MSALPAAGTIPRGTVPPGPKGEPVLGNLRQLREDRLGYLQYLARTYGDVVRIRLLQGDAYLLNRPEYIEEVLVTKKRHFVKARGTRALKALLGNGLLVSEGDFWRRQRRLAQPAFHRDRVAAYSAQMVEAGEQMLAGWSPGREFDVHEEMMRVTVRIVGRALFSTDVLGAASQVGSSLTVALSHFNWWSASGFMIPIWLPVRPNREFARARRELDRLVHDIIAQRRASREDPGDLLSMLLSVRDDEGIGMTDVAVRDEVLTLLLAGHETTANALTWTFVLLSGHPEADGRLAAELRDVLGGRAPALPDLPRLPYTEMVIKESLRLYPPVWVIGYEAIDDVTIGPYSVPKGTTAFMSQWVMHHDARWFADPDEFRPERWAEPEMRKISNYVYFPFGGGERLCIGRPFALMEAALLLATIAGRYRLGLVAGQTIVPQPSVTLRPQGRVMMTPEPR